MCHTDLSDWLTSVPPAGLCPPRVRTAGLSPTLVVRSRCPGAGKPDLRPAGLPHSSALVLPVDIQGRTLGIRSAPARQNGFPTWQLSLHKTRSGLLPQVSPSRVPAVGPQSPWAWNRVCPWGGWHPGLLIFPLLFLRRKEQACTSAWSQACEVPDFRLPPCRPRSPGLCRGGEGSRVFTAAEPEAPLRCP